MEYVVISLTLGGLGKKTFNYGDIVTERNFKDGRANELVEKGFLRAKIIEEKTLKTDNFSKKILLISEIEISEIKKFLKDKKIQFDKNASKKDLYGIWIKEQ